MIFSEVHIDASFSLFFCFAFLLFVFILIRVQDCHTKKGKLETLSSRDSNDRLIN